MNDERSLISVTIKNVKGSLAKITTYCAQNNVNIERLVLSNFKLDNLEHRVMLYITKKKDEISSLIKGLKEIDVVVAVENFRDNSYLERELILLKINKDNQYFANVVSLLKTFNGQLIFDDDQVAIFQFINNQDMTTDFMSIIEKMNTDIEITKSGIIAIALNKK